jgi:hypothetical protein
MPDPVPEHPSEAGIPEEKPEELGQLEGAFLLANEARERLHARGFTDVQIDEWAEAFIAEQGSGTVDQFVAWIAAREGS